MSGVPSSAAACNPGASPRPPWHRHRRNPPGATPFSPSNFAPGGALPGGSPPLAVVSVVLFLKLFVVSDLLGLFLGSWHLFRFLSSNGVGSAPSLLGIGVGSVITVARCVWRGHPSWEGVVHILGRGKSCSWLVSMQPRCLQAVVIICPKRFFWQTRAHGDTMIHFFR